MGPPADAKSERHLRRDAETRAQQRAAGTNKTALFDIVKRIPTTAHARAAMSRAGCAFRSRVPGERASASEDPGPRGDTTRRFNVHRFCRVTPGSRIFAPASPSLVRDTRVRRAPSRRAQSGPLAVIPIHDVKQRSLVRSRGALLRPGSSSSSPSLFASAGGPTGASAPASVATAAIPSPR